MAHTLAGMLGILIGFGAIAIILNIILGIYALFKDMDDFY